MDEPRTQVPIYPDRKLLEGRLSRRHLFQTLAGGVTVAGMASLLFRGETARAQSKVSQAVAKYQDHPNDGKNCATCNYFRPPQSCQLVEGTISANGWCRFYLKKP